MNTHQWPSSIILFGLLVLILVAIAPSTDAEEDYNVLHSNGAYEFGYENENNFHRSRANSRNVVRGEFGGRSPKGGVDVTSYTAGPRGYRPRGKLIHRKFDQSQTRRGPIGSRDDPYFDPNEDPSYDFGFKTKTYQRKESANRRGDVNGQYSYIDDVGERHNVEFIAGKDTGFHVKTPFPDSNPKAYGPLFFNGRGRPYPRGRTSIQRGTDGSYRFVSAGPDQRRTEVSDSQGNVRGSYTYLDDKGVQHSVHYIAGPGIGYRVLKNVKGPHIPSVYPFNGPNIIPPDFYPYLDKNSEGGVFNAAETGSGGTGTGTGYDSGDFGTDYEADGGYGSGRPLRPNRPGGRPGGRPITKPSGARPITPEKPISRPSYDYDDGGDVGGDDLFGNGSGTGSSSTVRPAGTAGKPSTVAGDASSAEDVSGTGDVGLGSTFGSGSSGTNVGSSSSRPGGDDYDDGAEDDLFGGPSVSTSRPRPSISRPSGGKPGSGQGSSSGHGSGSSLSSSSGSSSSSRPSSRPGSRPGSSRPTPNLNEDDGDLNDLNDGLFGVDSDSNLGLTSGTSATSKPHIISITGTGDGKKTLVTNLGDRTFTVPPGVSVHAHVQSIDLFPYESKVPTPADQFRAETTRSFQRLTTRQVNREDEKLVTLLPIQHDSTEAITTTLPSTTVPTTTKPDTKKSNEVSEEYEDDDDEGESTDLSEPINTTEEPSSTATTKTIK